MIHQASRKSNKIWRLQREKQCSKSSQWKCFWGRQNSSPRNTTHSGQRSTWFLVFKCSFIYFEGVRGRIPSTFRATQAEPKEELDLKHLEIVIWAVIKSRMFNRPNHTATPQSTLFMIQIMRSACPAGQSQVMCSALPPREPEKMKLWHFGFHGGDEGVPTMQFPDHRKVI